MLVKIKNFELNKRKIYVKCSCNTTPEFLVTNQQFNTQITNCGCITNYNHFLDKYIKQLYNITDLKLLTINNFKINAYFGVFECYCGNYFESRISYVREKRTLSCGCFDHKRRSYRGGITTVDIYKKPYKSWIGMNYRCNNQNLIDYKNYGGRGIKVCDKWSIKNPDGFHNFINDIGLPPSNMIKPTIERINVYGNYKPSNCKWLEFEDQKYNKTTSIIKKEDVIIIRNNFKHKLVSIDQMAEDYNCCRSNIEKIVYNLSWKDV
jgi:hypothetical protein